jgi:hypothetical protein
VTFFSKKAIGYATLKPFVAHGNYREKACLQVMCLRVCQITLKKRTFFHWFILSFLLIFTKQI